MLVASVQAGLVKRAFGAQGDLFTTAGFGKLNDLGVVIVIKGDLFGEVLHEQVADLAICLVALQDADA
jgi:hypothetical protein